MAICREKGISLINVEDGAELGTKMAAEEYSALCSSPDGRRIAAITKREGSLHLINSETWTIQEKIKIASKDPLPINWSMDSTCLSVGGWNPEIIIVDGYRAVRHKEWDTIKSGPFTKQGKYLIVATPWLGRHVPTDHADFQIRDVESGGLVATMRLHDGLGSCAALSPDGQLMATGGWDKQVKIWKLDFSKIVKNALPVPDQRPAPPSDQKSPPTPNDP
jgi:WD40 repeat protein